MTLFTLPIVTTILLQHTEQPVVKVPTAFDRRCIPAGGVAPCSNMARYSQSSRLATGTLVGLGARRDFHHGLLASGAAEAGANGRRPGWRVARGKRVGGRFVHEIV